MMILKKQTKKQTNNPCCHLLELKNQTGNLESISQFNGSPASFCLFSHPNLAWPIEIIKATAKI